MWRPTFHKKAVYIFLKRMFDIFVGLFGLLVLWPLFLIVSLLIYLEDPSGSPLFAQTRVGKRGKEFRLYKFRSMTADAEQRLDELMKFNEADGPVFKIKDDPRITRVGKFLRKTSIDELPQLLNVVKGDMSLVGPRPPLPREVALYNAYQKQRLKVKPGITCYWQAHPDRNSCSFDEWVKLDLKYIQERSVLTDLKIILMTVRAVFRMDGI